MANWQRRCSSRPATPTERHRRTALLSLAAVLACGCGQAGEHQSPPEARQATASATTGPAAGEPLCVAAHAGNLSARLRGAIEAEIEWGIDHPHCQADVRPQGDGLRLVYKGEAAEAGRLLLVFGLVSLRPGESARNVPVNLTVVREGAGQFFATQGQDKCALDVVTQAPVAGQPSLFRLEGRGYCTQPARAVTGDGAVLLSRFDVVAIVRGPDEDTR